jgi:hypothetical protein
MAKNILSLSSQEVDIISIENESFSITKKSVDKDTLQK